MPCLQSYRTHLLAAAKSPTADILTLLHLLHEGWTNSTLHLLDLHGMSLCWCQTLACGAGRLDICSADVHTGHAGSEVAQCVTRTVSSYVMVDPSCAQGDTLSGVTTPATTCRQ